MWSQIRRPCAAGLDTWNVTRYIEEVIRSFRHSGLEKFFTTGSKAGIQPAHAKKLQAQLIILDQARQPLDMGTPGWELHPLRGDLAGHWSVKVNGNWRMIFAFEGSDAVLVDYLDYH
jgi:proteic killer suppression protein